MDKDINEQELVKDEDKKNVTMNSILGGIGIALGSIMGVVLLGLLILVISGFQFYYVLTSSMTPTIYAGETVLVNTNIDKENLQVGDIVTFNKGGLNVTHRIIEVTQDANGAKIYVQGSDIAYREKVLGEEFENIPDQTLDGIISPGDVVGRVVTISEKPVKLLIIGEIMKMFRAPNALNIAKIVLIVAIAGLIIWSIVSFVREKREKLKWGVSLIFKILWKLMKIL